MEKTLKKKIAELRNQIGKISKDKKNPFFNSQYFDINQLLDNLQPHLMELDLDIIQPIEDNKVVTIIRDLDSDNTERSELQLPDLSDPQKMGSAITYYRRYTLQSLLALQAEDDDANKASGRTTKKKDDDDKEWLNEADEERWMKCEKFVKEGGNPHDLRKKYKVSNANMEYFETLYREAGH